MVQKLSGSVPGTRPGPGFRLSGTPRPTTRSAIGKPGADPQAKRGGAQQLIEGAPGVRRGNAAFAGLMTLFAQRVDALNQTVRRGPGGSNEITPEAVAAQVNQVSQRFDVEFAKQVDAIRGGNAALGAEYPPVPDVGRGEGDGAAGFLGAEGRADEFRLVMDMLRHAPTVDAAVRVALKAVETNDRELADCFVYVVLGLVAVGGPWYAEPNYTPAMALVEDLQEHFRTVRSVAGEIAPGFVWLREQGLATLTGLWAQRNPQTGQLSGFADLPVYIKTRTFSWFETPELPDDPTGWYPRYQELQGLFVTQSPTRPGVLSDDGSRIVALDAEAPGPARPAGNRDAGSRPT